MDPQLQKSEFYDPKPMFSGAVSPQKISRLDGNRGQLVFALIVVVAAAVSGLIFFLNPRAGSEVQTAPTSTIQTR